MPGKYFWNICFCSVVLISCSKDYDIQLPANKSELVVECYLEDGEPLRALISESIALLDNSIVPPVFIPATVVITYRNVRDTLKPFVYLDTVKRRGYNYGSSKMVHADYTSNEPYQIDVYDNRGRHASGITRFIKPVTIESLTPVFNNQQKAYCLTNFKEDPAALNYFRLVLNKNSMYDNLNLDVLLDKTFVNDKHEFNYGSEYNFTNGDVIHARLYHLTYEYYQYLITLQNARNALDNPFAVSGEVVSNISGGLGVFCALSFSQKRVTVQ